MAPQEFEPPSDFVEEDDSGGGMSAWKWLGIGCGVVVLVVGALLAFGTWKSVSCCQQMGEAVEGSTMHGSEFARALASGKYDEARSMMSQSLASQTTEADLREELAPYQSFFDEASPRIAGQDVNQEGGFGGEEMLFALRYEFSPESSEEKLVLLVDVAAREEGGGYTYQVEDYQLEERRRKLSSEPPAELVLNLHEHVYSGNYEEAFELMRDDPEDGQDLESFKGFIKEHEEIFMASEIDIGSVDYDGQSEARVRADAIEGDQVVASLEYLVEVGQGVPPGWRITSIHPNYSEEPGEVAEDAEDAEDLDEEESGAEDEEEPADPEGERADDRPQESDE